MPNEIQNVHATVEAMTAAFQNKDIANVMTAYESAATVVLNRIHQFLTLLKLNEFLAA